MPCVQAKARAEHKAYVEQNRVDIDRFIGVTDSVEIIRLIHEELPRDELKNYLPYHESVSSVYRSLSEGDGNRLVEMALRDENLIEEVAPRLALFTAIDIKKLQLQLLTTKDPYPEYVFRGADQQIVMRLLQLIKEKEVRNQALSALAWTKHPIAIEQFQRWRKNPPPWSSELYVPVHQYTEGAGYEIRDNGIRNLYYEKCFQLVPRLISTDTTTDEEVQICSKPVGLHPCPKCGSNLIELLSLNMHCLSHSEQLTTNYDVSFPTCLNCCDIFFAKHFHNKWEQFSREQSPPPYVQSDNEGWSLPPHASTLNLPRKPWEAVDWCLADGISQLGGLPSPINDPVYPKCPSCLELMNFVSQIAVEELISGEGIYYAFLCERCAITATTYDQT